MKYVPGSFSDVFGTELGQALWAFLNERENIVRMETATYLKCPAVEALTPGLLERFGDAVRKDRIKQCIGNMIRQIMESRGYQLDRQNVRIADNLFASATRYRQRSVAAAA
jgi:hypothetical protein